MINGERVKQARELRGLTQATFAENIGVHQSAVAQIESGRITPSDEVLQRIILQTGFPMSFFRQPTSTEFPLGSLLFRARASMTARERSQARQYAGIVLEIAERMEKNINKIPLRLPRLDDDPINAAIQTRSSLGLAPDTPINNLINTIEKNGVLVLALPTELKRVDAFSAWVNNESRRPVIVICNKNLAGDRLRLSVAHELGHLVIHQAMRGDSSIIEREAFEFASELLMPKEIMTKELIVPITLVNLLPLKRRWKVSLQALIRRAFNLGIITSRQYKYLMQQITVRGWRIKEPENISPEKPRMISQVAELLYGIPIDYKRIASYMNLPLQLVKDTIEAHATKNGLNNNQKGTINRKILTFAQKKTNISDVLL